MGVLALTIGGAAYVIGTSAYDIDARWEIVAPANGAARFSCRAVADVATNIPAIDQEIVLTEDGTPIFGGFIGEPQLEGISGHPTDPVVADISALDYNTLPSRRFAIDLTIVAGTLKQALLAIIGLIDGVTLDAAQVNGPSLPELRYDGWTIEQVLNQLTTLSGYVWRINASKVLSMKAPGSTAAPFNLAAGDGNTIGDVKVTTTRNTYANYIIVQGADVKSTAQNSGEITAHGRWELLLKAPDVTTQAAADALAAAALSASAIIVKKVAYPTDLGGLEPGQTQTINLPTRGVNNTFLITEVKTQGRGEVVTRQVQAIEGTVYKTGWREEIKQWGGNGGGLSLPGLTGTTGGTRSPYVFAAAPDHFVSSPTPDWVDVSPVHVQINTAVRHTTEVTLIARLRALSAGISVRARLYEVGAGPVTGTSPLVTNTDWETVTWTVDVTAGSHYYVMQVLPGAADEPVSCVAYGE